MTTSKPDTMNILTGKFKAKCLKLIDKIYHQKLVTKSIFGCMEGTVTIHDDITKPIDTEWDVLK